MRTFYKIGDGSLQVAKYTTKLAAEALIKNVKNISHKEYFMTDKELGHIHKIKTAMVKKIRDAAGIPIREDRILRILRTMPTHAMYLDDIILGLQDNVTYNTLYKLLRANGVPFLLKNKINNTAG